MKLSIIVPVYNVGPYVERCLRSLEDQDLPKDQYEIIVTNDGSPDNSREVVLRLQKEFDNIILVDQENQGVSMARNNAIAQASGKFILPIDPDDYILPNTLQRILEHCERDKLDVLYLSFDILNESGRLAWQTQFEEKENKVLSGVEAYFSVRGPQVRDPDRSWAILYRKAMLDEYDIQYPQNVPYLEDGLFLAKVFSVAQHCGFDATPFYQRTTRPGSATNSKLIFSEKSLKGFILAAKDIISFRERYRFNEQQRGLVNHVLAKFVFLPVTASIDSKNLKLFRQVKALIKTNGFDQLDLRGCRNIFLNFGRVYNVSINAFFVYYYFFSRLRVLKDRLANK